MEKKSKGGALRRLGMAGTIIGLLALGAAVFHFFYGPLETPPPVEETVADLAVNLKNAITAKIEGETYQAPVEASHNIDDYVRYGTIALGFIALALGVMGFVSKEEWRPSGAAIALGGAAITFQFTVYIAGAILCILLIYAVLSSLGLDSIFGGFGG